MPQDEDTKVFDVSKPNKIGPSPTSRPIIMGHHPVMNDPMVKEGTQEPHITPIHIAMDEKDEAESVFTSSSSASAVQPDSPSAFGEELLPHHDEPENIHEVPHTPEEHPVVAGDPHRAEEKSNDSSESHFTSLNSLLSGSHKSEDKNPEADNYIPPPPPPGSVHNPVDAPLPIPRGAGPYRRWPRI
jgi:hypothetical protein